MKAQFKAIILLLYFFVFIFVSFGQCPNTPVCTQTGALSPTVSDYKARDAVSILPEASAVVTGNQQIRLFVDKNIQLPASYDPGGPHSSNFTVPPIDPNLPVGTIAGSGNVTPSGQAVYNIPITVPPGTNGMAPTLGISYNSGSSDGLVGRGWNINGVSSITRVPKEEFHDCLHLNNASAFYRKGIQLDGTDAYALDGMRLIATNQDVNLFKLENDDFSLVTYSSSNNSFTVQTKGGTTMEYGTTSDSKLMCTNPSVALTWYLKKVSDNFGNYISYFYDNNTTNREVVLKEIKYTANDAAGVQPYNSIKFYYDIRTDQTIRYVLDNDFKNTLVLREIEVENEGNFVKGYQFKYGYDSQTFLNEIIEQGSDYSKLNSTFIKYGENVTQTNAVSNTVETAVPANADYYTGDFNGDGKSDLLGFIYSSISPVGLRTYTGWQLLLNNDDGTNYTVPNLSNTQLPSNFTPYNISEYFSEWGPTPSGIQTYDINADGMDDVIIGHKVSHDIYYTVYLSTGNPANWFSEGITFFMDETSKLVLADIDGDGKPEGIEYRYNPDVSSTNLFKIYWLETGNCAILDKVYDASGNPVTGYSGFTPIDFDGDGIQELMTSRGIQKTIIKLLLEPGCVNTSCTTCSATLYPHESREIWSESFGVVSIRDYTQNMFGDFNGDGITDIVKISSPYNPGNRSARIFLGTGTGYASPQLISGMTSFSVNTKYFVADINNDGKSDLVQMSKIPGSISLWVCYGNQIQPLAITYLGAVSSVEFPDNQDYFLNTLDVEPWLGEPDDLDQTNDFYPLCPNNTDVCPDKVPEFLIGDFDGDGRTDLFFKTNSGGTRMIAFFNKSSTTHLATSISDGFRLNTKFKYATLANGGSNVYVKGSGATYPMMEVQMPSYVVKEFTLPDGIGGANTTTYKYEGAQVHLQGKGFLGFDKVTSSNALANRKVETNYSFLNPQPPAANSLYEKAPSSSKSYLASPSNQLVTEETYTASSHNSITRCSNKGVSHYNTTDHIVSIDWHTGAKVIKDFTYDSYGNPTKTITKVTDKNNINNTTPFIETTIVDQNFIHAGNWGPFNVVENSTTTVNRNEDQNPDIIRTVHNTYNISNGHLTQTIQDPLNTRMLQTDYSLYDANTGVLKRMVVSNPGEILQFSKEVNYGYDGYSRFITQTINPIGQNAYATYDPKWGAPLTETSVDGLVTKYQYDGFGRATSVKTPDNLTATTNYAWVLPGSLNTADYIATTFGYDIIWNSLFSVTTQRPGSPSSRTIYDIYSRELASDMDGFNNKIFSATKYDARGNIYKQCGVYENVPGAQAPVITTNSFNSTFNQLFKTESKAGSSPINTTDIVYIYNGDGTERTETTTPDGKLFSKTTDATGILKSASDDAGSLEYSYNHSRQLKQTKLNSVITNTVEYDDLGMQTKLTEVNSGVTQYEYDAFGDLTKQTDANSNVTNLQYDILGRITQKTLTPSGPPPPAPDSYNYSYVTSGNGLNLLQSVSVSREFSNENISYTYTYDNLNRIKKVDENINGPVFSTSYEYDAYNNISKEIFPSTFAIKHAYNAHGYHIQINRNDNGSLIYHADAMNPAGQYTAYTLGNGIQTQKTYTEFGFPHTISAPGVQNMAFDFNQQNGNLNSRTDVLKGLDERFTYDFDRLHTVLGPGNLTVNYSPNGNITDKSDATLLANGYVYDPQKSNALISINKPLNISQLTQNISYTSFSKAQIVSEDADELDFFYGPGDERKKTILQNNSVIQSTRYFSGDYEKTIAGSNVTEVHYISGGSGLAAMYVIENGNGAMYYPYTDYLGSILTVTDDQGNPVAEQSFDAWGRNRNPDDWTYQNIAVVPSWLYRGYTGHEHLPQFALINMNGRMYDPVVGRMLSADNNLQLPEYSQNYNRYTYALNNPLKFTDPTGNEYDDLTQANYDMWKTYGNGWFDHEFGASEFDRENFRYNGGSGGNINSNGTFTSDATMVVEAHNLWKDIQKSLPPDYVQYPVDKEGRTIPTIEFTAIGYRSDEMYAYMQDKIDFRLEMQWISRLLPQGGLCEPTPWVEDIAAAGIPGLFRLGMGEGSTTLYRAVSQAELEDIPINGIRNFKGYETGKLFANSAQDAANFGKINYSLDLKYGFDIPFTIIKTSISNKYSNMLFKTEMDLMEGISVPKNLFNQLSRPTFLNYSPIPKHPWIN